MALSFQNLPIYEDLLMKISLCQDSVLRCLRTRQRPRSASRAPKARGTSASARVRFAESKPNLCLPDHFQPPYQSPTIPSQAPPTSFTAYRQSDFITPHAVKGFNITPYLTSTQANMTLGIDHAKYSWFQTGSPDRISSA